MTDLVERLRWNADLTLRRDLSLGMNDLLSEAATEIERLRSWGVPEGHRMCVNCGRDLKLTDKRGEDWCRDEYPGQDFYACTGDMTYGELIAEIHRLKDKVRTIIAAHPAAIEEARDERRISHDDACRLSRAFCLAAGPITTQDCRINEWLKKIISTAYYRDKGEKP